jgi:hypothetical protein
MDGFQMKLFFWFLLIFYLTVANAFAATDTDPCASSNFLNLIDRPTSADSPCAIKFKNFATEAGYQYAKISHTGYAQTLPQTEFRVGLPANNEFVVLAPNYIHLSAYPHSGATATGVGLKHEIGYTSTLIGAVESIITLPSGSDAYGSDGTGVALNAILSYTYNPQLNLTFQIGATSLTLPSLFGGTRFTSFNPDAVVTYSLTPKFDIYIEGYGATRTAPQQGSGFITDGGVIYLLQPNFVIDLEAGQRISGKLLGIDHYFGTGMSLQF